MSQTQITIFTQTGCYPCTLWKKWLNEQNIPFTEKNIKEDKDALNEFDKLGLEYTPHTFVEHKKEKYEIKGLGQKKMLRILNS